MLNVFDLYIASLLVLRILKAVFWQDMGSEKEETADMRQSGESSSERSSDRDASHSSNSLIPGGGGLRCAVRTGGPVPPAAEPAEGSWPLDWGSGPHDSAPTAETFI